MKTVWIVAMVALVGLMGCEESQMTAWGLSAQNTDLMARVGVEDDNNTELFLVAKYAVSETIEEEDFEPDYAGGGILFHLTQDVTIEDTPEASPFAAFLETLHARPYAGLELITPLDGDHRRVQPNWIAGTKFMVAPDSDWALVVEYLDGDQGESGVFLGAMGRF